MCLVHPLSISASVHQLSIVFLQVRSGREGAACWCAGGGSLRGVADGFAELPTNGDRDHIGGVDIVYLKNVLLKFLDSLASGRTEQVTLHGHCALTNVYQH